MNETPAPRESTGSPPPETPRLAAEERPRDAGKTSLKRSALSNLAVMGVGILVTFLVTPAMIAHLGERRYGMWTLVSSLVGYFSLLQFGLTTSLFRYVPLFRGKQEWGRLSGIVSTALGFYSGVGVVALFILFFGAERIAAYFGGGPELAGLVRVIGLAFALELPSLILQTTVTGYERFATINAINFWTLLLRGILLYGCVRLGLGLVAMGWTLVIVRVCGLATQWLTFRKLCPEVHLRLSEIRWAELKLLLMFGSVIVIASTGNALAVEAPKQIVGKAISLEALSVFGVVAMLLGYFRQVIFTMTKVLTPRYSFLSGQAADERIRALFMKSSRYVAMLTTGMALLIWLGGPSFLVLWTRAERMREGIPALLILTAGNFVLLSHRVTSDLLLGLGRQGVLAAFEVGEALAILGLTFLLCASMGITGVALAMAVSFAITRGVLQPIVVCRLLGLSAATYFRQGVVGPWFIALALAGLAWIGGGLHLAHGWVELTAICLIAGFCYVMLLYLAVASAEERAQVNRRLATSLGHVRCLFSRFSLESRRS